MACHEHHAVQKYESGTKTTNTRYEQKICVLKKETNMSYAQNRRHQFWRMNSGWACSASQCIAHPVYVVDSTISTSVSKKQQYHHMQSLLFRNSSIIICNRLCFEKKQQYHHMQSLLFQNSSIIICNRFGFKKTAVSSTSSSSHFCFKPLHHLFAVSSVLQLLHRHHMQSLLFLNSIALLQCIVVCSILFFLDPPNAR